MARKAKHSDHRKSSTTRIRAGSGAGTAELDRPEEEEPSEHLVVDTELEWLKESERTDPAKVAAVAERVFDSVLARYGWMRDARGHLEHVGEEEINA